MRTFILDHAAILFLRIYSRLNTSYKNTFIGMFSEAPFAGEKNPEQPTDSSSRDWINYGVFIQCNTTKQLK